MGSLVAAWVVIHVSF